jgi:hypothetical protein
MNDDISIKVFHASDREMRVEDIKFPGPRSDCDFGAGFYLTENRQVANEWVCNAYTPVINEYRFTFNKKNVLYLEDSKWLKVVLGYRKRAYKVNFKSNIIYGLIANDRMVDVIPLFIGGIIGDKRLIECLDFCKFGNQYCLKNSADGLEFTKSFPLKGQELVQAQNSSRLRKSGMTSQLRAIQRSSIAGEKFVEDYLAEGDYDEVRV